MKATVQRIRRDAGCVIAIVGPQGYKFTRAVWIDAPVRLRKLKNRDVARGACSFDSPPVKRAARRMLQAGESLGITKGARDFLKEVISS